MIHGRGTSGVTPWRPVERDIDLLLVLLTVDAAMVVDRLLGTGVARSVEMP